MPVCVLIRMTIWISPTWFRPDVKVPLTRWCSRYPAVNAVMDSDQRRTRNVPICKSTTLCNSVHVMWNDFSEYGEYSNYSKIVYLYILRELTIDLKLDSSWINYWPSWIWNCSRRYRHKQQSVSNKWCTTCTHWCTCTTFVYIFYIVLIALQYFNETWKYLGTIMYAYLQPSQILYSRCHCSLSVECVDDVACVIYRSSIMGYLSTTHVRLISFIYQVYMPLLRFYVEINPEWSGHTQSLMWSLHYVNVDCTIGCKLYAY